jgi:hypothetical protein
MERGEYYFRVGWIFTSVEAFRWLKRYRPVFLLNPIGPVILVVTIK